MTPSLTEYGYCPRCEHRRELVMTSAGVLACHACESVDVYDSKAEYEEAEAVRREVMGE